MRLFGESKCNTAALASLSFSLPSFIPYCIAVLQVTYKLCSTHKQFACTTLSLN